MGARFFLENDLCSQKLGKRAKIKPKIGFFELREKFGHKAKTCPK